MFSPRLLFASVIALGCLATLAFGAALLPNDEVEALRQIANTLGKKDWNFSADPCGGQLGWATPNPVPGSENAVTCNCSFSNSTICHVVSIVLKSQSLVGVLPQELVKLPYLQEIDLSRNCLTGTIPSEWGSLKLVNISLLGNRLTGLIPKEFGSISTLVNISVEFNQLSGVLPPELGNLLHIEKMHLTSNNFTGELPEAIARLTTLKDFRIGENNFTGSIPIFIKNWTNLEKLVIQASGLDGPIPAGIASLEKLSDLRISDLGGIEIKFPPLSNMKNLKTLILRSCNIIGPLPDYLGEMTKLKALDLSFNKLSGEIPSSFDSLSEVDFVYLTGNLLIGPVPDWILKDGQNIDLSYNNFTFGNSGALSCQQRSVNLFGSSIEADNSAIVSCLRSFRCPQNWNSLHINCGGNEVTIDENTRYDDDTNSAGPSSYFQSRTNWAYSSTGNFVDDNRPIDSYIWSTNVSKPSMNNNVLYMDARLSPLSLTYYGFCLLNRNYTVNLHFAEIMFTDDNTYSSNGRRIFDVYIQGNLVLKDFNIEDDAGGVGKAIIKSFTTVVTHNTLEIRFFWAGKGTTGIPVRGVYGPLISAISVDPDFIPPSKNGNGISTGAVVGIVVSAAFVIFLVLGILWWRGCLGRKDNMEQGNCNPLYKSL